MELSSLVNPPYTPSNDATTSRFSAAKWFSFVQSQDVYILGVGGIGSWLSLMLSRLNPHWITLTDDDTVEIENMAGQFFSNDQLGKYKVESASLNIKYFSNNYTRVNTFRDRFTEESIIPKVVFCGFDNMQSRKLVYYKWKRAVQDAPSNTRKDFLFIDGRLSAETFQVFCITGDASYYMEQYEKDWLFSDEEADSTVCSYKQTSYCANMIASVMTNLYVNWCTNHCEPIIDRALPFMTEYSAEQLYFRTIS